FRSGVLGRRLLGGRRSGLLGRSLDGLRCFALFVGRRGGGDEPHLIARRHRLAPLGRTGHEKQAREPVHQHRPCQAQADIGGRPAALSHRSIVSGSATSPTSLTPDARITASTWTTLAYGTRPSARRYTPLGRLVRTSAPNVARKSS